MKSRQQNRISLTPFFLCGTGVWTWGLTLDKQALYHSTSSFLCWAFWDRISQTICPHCPWTWSSFLDYRSEPLASSLTPFLLKERVICICWDSWTIISECQFYGGFCLLCALFSPQIFYSVHASFFTKINFLKLKMWFLFIDLAKNRFKERIHSIVEDLGHMGMHKMYSANGRKNYC
jgi:hypothetical protein